MLPNYGPFVSWLVHASIDILMLVIVPNEGAIVEGDMTF